MFFVQCERGDLSGQNNKELNIYFLSLQRFSGNFFVLVYFHQFLNIGFGHSKLSLVKKLYKNTVHYLPSTKRQKDKVREAETESQINAIILYLLDL